MHPLFAQASGLTHDVIGAAIATGYSVSSVPSCSLLPAPAWLTDAAGAAQVMHFDVERVHRVVGVAHEVDELVVRREVPLVHPLFEAAQVGEHRPQLFLQRLGLGRR
jgi:hypothetical protein